MVDKLTAKVKGTHRISMTSEEIAELAQHLAAIKQGAGSLSRNLSSIYSKMVINQTKVELGVKTADYVITGTGKSAMSKLGAIDPETYLMEYGNPEEQAAINESLTQTIITGEPCDWRQYLPAPEVRKYPATKIPGMETEL